MKHLLLTLSFISVAGFLNESHAKLFNNGGFTSTDRQHIDIRGNAKQVVVHRLDYDKSISNYVENESEKKTYSFSKKGVLAHNFKTDKLTRDKKGRLIKKETTISDSKQKVTKIVTEEFSYDKDGNVSSITSKGDSNVTTCFYYDADGNCTSALSYYNGKDVKKEESTTYKIEATDLQENWTVRKATCITKYRDVVTGVFSKQDTTFRYEKRDITYLKK
ncbi:MAG: hypothetical protein MJY63_04840 [Paludibacteraceae bacterium]|nr:hypothetical protein [Paludibacteraceae bacterium]